MNGPEHYKEAERLLGTIEQVKSQVQRLNGSAHDMEFAVTAVVQVSQVHATLALTAATVHEINPRPGDIAGKAWIEVTS